MSEQEIKDIIFDLYLVMRFRGYKRISIYTSIETKNVSIGEISIPTRAQHVFKNLKIKTLADALWLLNDSDRIKNLRGMGVSTISDIRNSILLFHISNNVCNGRKPLFGVKLS